MAPSRLFILIAIAVCWGLPAPASSQIARESALLFADFASAENEGKFELHHGARKTDEGRLEFLTARQFAELIPAQTAALSRGLRDVEALSVGGWFFTRRAGEQVLLARGDVETAPLGERMFRPSEQFVNFCLGTDQHGFLMGAINGNGSMPFVHVTLNEAPIQTWQQLVVVKDADGFHHFYQNGVPIHDDRRSMHAPSRQPWRETEEGLNEPVRIQVPLGGLIGEVWVAGRALSADEIFKDYQTKRERFSPAPPGKNVPLRDLDARWPAGPLDFDRDRVLQGVMQLLGPFPTETPPLNPEVVAEEDCGPYLRRKVWIQVEPDDRMPLWLLIPKERKQPAPAVICFYGTTSGAGKDVTVGRSGRKPGTPPARNMSFALDVVEAGFIAVAPDYLRDGERIYPGEAPYDTTRFYEKHPEWSIHGKDIWDTSRLIDYLETLDFVDADRIGMMGHSYGGHSTIFTAALEPRIKAAVANGPVSAFREHGLHWAVPKGAGASQSLPAMRPFILSPETPLPATFAQWMALIAPRPLWVGQAVGERRPIEEENAGYVKRVYQSLGAGDQVRYVWYAGDHDFPPEARAAPVGWLRKAFADIDVNPR